MVNVSPEKKLTYQNLDRDIERCCFETGETILGMPVTWGLDEPSGPSHTLRREAAPMMHLKISGLG